MMVCFSSMFPHWSVCCRSTSTVSALCSFYSGLKCWAPCSEISSPSYLRVSIQMILICNKQSNKHVLTTAKDVQFVPQASLHLQLTGVFVSIHCIMDWCKKATAPWYLRYPDYFCLCGRALARFCFLLGCLSDHPVTHVSTVLRCIWYYCRPIPSVSMVTAGTAHCSKMIKLSTVPRGRTWHSQCSSNSAKNYRTGSNTYSFIATNR